MHRVQRPWIPWLRYLSLALLRQHFQLWHLVSEVTSGNEWIFENADGHWQRGNRLGNWTPTTFLFFTDLLFVGSPCKACWQELINLFMGWTELAPIIQGVELLNGGNKRLYPLPICPPFTLCPVFSIPRCWVPFLLVIVVYSYVKKNNINVFCEKYILPNASFEYWLNSYSICNEK